MFSQENTFAVAMVVALTVAVVTALAALMHALGGFQSFW
jgi:hypothetical protein